MLKNIPESFSPDLMAALMRMGHTDEIVLADAHFPSHSHARYVIDCHGISSITLLNDILKFLPLDYITDSPVSVMKLPDGLQIPDLIYDEYKTIVEKHENRSIGFEMLERYDFYERSSKSFAVIATGEKRRFANIILRKGVVKI